MPRPKKTNEELNNQPIPEKKVVKGYPTEELDEFRQIILEKKQEIKIGRAHV